MKLNDNLSFHYNDEINEELKEIEGVEYKTLGEICKFLPKSKRNAKFGNDTGLYIFYTSSFNHKYCDTYDYEDELIIIGTGGPANIKIDKKFSCSADNLILKSNNIKNYYLYYYLI